MAFATELQEIVENIMDASADTSSLAPASLYETLLWEIDQIGWERLSDLEDSLLKLKLNATDKAGRTHLLNVAFSVDFPQTPPLCTADIPENIEIDWNIAVTSASAPQTERQSVLAKILTKFEEGIDRLQDLWEMLEDLDDHVWILDPQPPIHRFYLLHCMSLLATFQFPVILTYYFRIC
jgi:E3 ubiquitin-protein ligase FANCL